MSRALSVFSRVLHWWAVLGYLALAVLSAFMHSAAFVSYAATFFLVVTACAFLAANASDRRAGVDYMFLFFFTFFIAVPAFAQHRAGVYPWFVSPSPRRLSMAYGVLSMALMSYLLALSFGIWVRTQRRARPSRSIEGSARFYTAWAWGIAFASFLFLAAAGPSSFLEPRFAQVSVRQGMNAQFTFIARSIGLLAMVMMLYLARSLPPGRLLRRNIVALVLYAPVFLLLVYPPALPRFMLFGTVIAICCPFIDFSKPRNKVLTTLVAVPMLFLVFPAIKALGTGSVDLLSAVAPRTGSAIGAYLLRVDFDGFMWLVMTIEYLERGGELRWGLNFLGVALFFVPRGIWASKPIDTGEIVSTGLGFRYTNVASPLPAEALISFGTLGPALVFALAGYSIARLETMGVARGQQLSRMFLQAMLAGFIVIILRGALNGVAPQFASGFLVYWMMMLAARKHNARRLKL